MNNSMNSGNEPTESRKANYKRPAFWIILIAVIACVVLVVCLMNLKGATLSEMRAILSTYEIDENDILIIPWQNPADVAVYGPDSGAIDIRTDICELYLQVLENLWNVDSGLNLGISQIGIDLSELSHLTEAEKETVMREFASKHDIPYIAGTWEELCEQGYIDKDNLRWEDGLFFSIKTDKEGGSDPEFMTFDAHKWRSGLGAYFFGQCTARKGADGKWSYTVGREAIS